MARRRKDNTNTRMVFSDYKVDPEMGLAQRMADSLVWYAEACPKRVVSWPELMKAVRQDRRKWPEDSEEIKRFKGLKSHADRCIEERYGKGIIMVPGEGLRASVDAKDLLDNHTPKVARRTARQIERNNRAVGLVDMRQLTDKDDRAYARGLKHTAAELGGALSKLKLLEGKREDKE